ncbi:MAG: hypothetical protein HY918_00740 [Candidatus Doudnabacteria bacterium]|nr:hypothetical protein [Candidatus Doudnabacteria bacterium]
MAKITINLKPPVTVAKEAAKGLELHHKFKRGGTAVGWARARELKNRQTVSPDTIYRMVSYFARHEVDKKGKNFFNKEKPSNGYIAWLLWGGDAGKTWAEKLKKQLKGIK